jgi:hypothetical protein
MRVCSGFLLVLRLEVGVRKLVKAWAEATIPDQATLARVLEDIEVLA